MAWHRPDQFRKVISTIGSFTNIMGGHVYPDLIRQSEPKPIRIFLQDGVNDNRGVRRGGSYDPNRDWHAQNIKMVEALTEKKYDVNYTWGIGTHSNKQGGAIMPEMLRWLWRDYPRKDDPKDSSDRSLLLPHERYERLEPAPGARALTGGLFHGRAVRTTPGRVAPPGPVRSRDHGYGRGRAANAACGRRGLALLRNVGRRHGARS